MLKLKRLCSKEAKEIKIAGIEIIEAQVNDNGLLSLRLKDADGQIVEIRKTGSYTDNIDIYVEEKKEKIKEYRVSGNIFESLVEIEKDFKTKGEAEKAKSKMMEFEPNAMLEIKEIEKEI